MSDDKAIRAAAEAWASIDGRLEKFEADEHMSLTDPRCTGHFVGYMADAEELLKRIEKRGFVLVPVKGASE